MRTFGLILLALIGFNWAASPLAADAACEAQCWDAYDYCHANCGSFWCWDGCDQERDRCLQYCSTCPRIVNDWTVTTVLSDTLGPLPLVCLSDQNFYRKHTVTYKISHYQDVLKCDGFIQRNLLSSFNSTKTCWKYTGPGPCIPNSNQAPIEQQCILP